MIQKPHISGVSTSMSNFHDFSSYMFILLLSVCVSSDIAIIAFYT